MSLFQIMETAESLLQLDPIRTYPQRGAEQVAKAVRASAFRLARNGKDALLSAPAPMPGAEPAVSLALRSGREVVGTLHLFLPDPNESRLGEDEMRVARWGARIFARGIGYTARLATEGGRRYGEAVEGALKRAPLTPRERDVVGLLVGGSRTRAIAETPGLTVSTVNTYLKRIFSKLGVHSRVELIARMAGTAPMPEHPGANGATPNGAASPAE